MNIDDLVQKLNTLTLKKSNSTWKNTFNSCRTHLIKDNYTKDEVIQLLNNFEDELMLKFMYYLRTTNTNAHHMESNPYTGPAY